MIRFFLYGLPAILVALIVASFVNVNLLSTKKKNEMSIGMLGEPSTLNPIKPADSAGAQVQGAIFSGLLKYDQNLEITTDLAKSYKLTQTTTVFFKTPQDAIAALGKLLFLRVRWPEWKLVDATQKDNALILSLGEPGMQISREIFALLKSPAVLPLQIVRVDLEEKAKDTLAAFHSANPAAAGILREWFESDGAFELTVAGDPKPFVEALKAFLATQPKLKAQVTLGESADFLAEPVVDFVLRDNVHWHDGALFTSHDVLFTYNAIMDDANASPMKPDFLPVLKVEAPDPRTLRVVYRKPFSPALGSWMMAILPAHILEGHPQDWWTEHFDRAPIGTGGYKFDQWKTNEYVRVVRNPDYYEKPGPWLDSIVYHVLPDQLTLRLAFETHQVDFWGVDPWAMKSFDHNPLYDVFTTPGQQYNYIGWNLRRPVFQDERVRQALACAVNVPEMVKYILYGYGEQCIGPFTPSMWFFNPHVHPYSYDPAKARELLAEAGWKPGKDGILEKDGHRFTFTLVTNNGNEMRRDIATLVQSDLRSLGIDVKIELYEWAVLIKNFVNKSDFDAIVLGWALGPSFDQYPIWHSSQNHPDQLNLVSYSNPEVDKLLVDIRQEYNHDTITTMAGQIQEKIYHDQPYLFLYVPESVSVIWKNSYRIRRPDGHGGWIDTPVQLTKAGWDYYTTWFYRPEYANLLPK